MFWGGVIVRSDFTLQMLVDAESLEGKTRIRFYRMGALTKNDYKFVEEPDQRMRLNEGFTIAHKYYPSASDC